MLDSELHADPSVREFHEEISRWAERFRQGLVLMENGQLLDPDLINLPRRKAADPTKAIMAQEIANILYPGMGEHSLRPIIRYEKDLVKLRTYIQTQRDQSSCSLSTRTDPVSHQGLWDEQNDPLSLEGVSSLPMPVRISDGETLGPFFNHLRIGGRDHILEGEDAEEKQEPFYGTHMIEFPKGILYADRRMDLCKMVVGPTHIGALIDSLETNTFTEHFLLGNNIIGPVGAKRIAAFVDKHPDRIKTWYLAGNCIDGPSFKGLVDSFIKSPSLVNVWFKRNPLGSSAAHDVFRLITRTPRLRTLDLDQTALGDAGVALLFNLLADHKPDSNSPLALSHIYLNGTGIGENGAKAIARYLATDLCTLVSLYANNNPLGDKGATALATGLSCNKSLQRLALSSNGLKDHGACILLTSLEGHSGLRMLDLGQSYATQDLGMRYNWLTDAIIPNLLALIKNVSTLRYLALDQTPMTRSGLNQIFSSVLESDLLYVSARSLGPQGRDYHSVKAGQAAVRLKELVAKRLTHNIAKEYDGMSLENFYADAKRFLTSPEDVRYIDSVYRNRDTGLARRGMKKLDKWWKEGDVTLDFVQNAV